MRKIFNLMWLAVASLPLACSSETGEGNNPEDGPGVSACSVGYDDCDNGCVDLQGDGQNCGACGSLCAAGQVCSAGVCQTSCTEPGRAQCDLSCVDLLTNPSHCGDCNVFCAGDQACQGGLCIDTGTGGSGVGTGGAALGTGGGVLGTGGDGLGTGGDRMGTGGGVLGTGGMGTGDIGTGGMGTGGMALGTGGMALGTGGMDTGTGGSTGGGLADEYPCDGSTAGYDYVVDGSGNSHTVNGSGSYSFQDAYTTALGNGNRSVLVLSSGNVSGAAQVRIQSDTVLNVCGTINVTNDVSGSDRSPAFARSASNIIIPNFNLTGSAQYGMFFREVQDVHLGEININGTGGLGIRIDNNPANNCWGLCNQCTNISIDNVSVTNTGGHGVETYGVDGLTIGTVTARNTTNAGLLLNATINTEVGLVDGEDAATGNGYATFRVANQAGRIGDVWPAGNIHVGTVRARRGGRGIFCVSDSGGTTIDNVDIADTGNNSMLLENCHNFRVAAVSGTVTNGGAIIITQRADEHTPTSNVTLQNLAVNGTSVDGRCGLGSGNVICNLSGNYSVAGGACLTNQASCP